ncbi:AGAP009485-PA, partial [Anopheles gambiae str. PEST]
MIEEPLCLFLEEAFFLMHVLNILCLKDTRGNTISVAQAFAKFRKVKRNFLACFCAYLYLKSKNWIIKSGIKFGGDFVVYVKGPQFYHASYIVLIQEVFDGADMQSSAIDGLDFQGFNRIAETTGKDLLFLEVHYPSALDLSDD